MIESSDGSFNDRLPGVDPSQGGYPGRRRAKEYPSSDPLWGIETRGIEPVPASDRHGRAVELFWLWCGANVAVISVVYGAILAIMGLNLWQAALVALIGTALSFFLVGVLSVSGKKRGTPALIISRAVFGRWGNIPPTLISWINLLGWETINTIIVAYALAELARITLHLPTSALLELACTFVACILALVLSVLGHATLAWIQRVVTILFGGMTLVLLPFLLTEVNWHAVVTKSPAPFASVLGAISIVGAATGISWVNVAADYSRYLPRSERSGSVIGWTTAGATFPVFLLIAVGFLVSTKVNGLATSTNPVGVLRTALPAWLSIPYLLTAVGGLLAETVLGLYSSGLNLLALGVKVKRYKTVFVDASVMTLGSAYVLLISHSFVAPFESFLELLADGLAPWAAILVVDLLVRRSYDVQILDGANRQFQGSYSYRSGINWAGLISWLVGVLLGLCFTVSPWFAGPFAKGVFARSSLGYFIALLAAGVVYGLYSVKDKPGASAHLAFEPAE